MRYYKKSKKETLFAHFMASGWPLIRVNIHVLLIIVIGIFAFTIPAQSQDYLNQFIVNYAEHPYNILNVVAAFYIWAYFIYFSVVLTIDKRQIIVKNSDSAAKIAILLPLGLSLLPTITLSFLLLFKYYKFAGSTPTIKEFLAIDIFVCIITYYKYYKNNDLRNSLSKSSSLIFLFKRKKYKRWGLASLALLLIIAVMILLPEIVMRWMSEKNLLNPLSIIGIGLSAYLVFFTLLGAYNNSLKKPLFILLFVYLALSSITNNSHEIEIFSFEDESSTGDIRNTIEDDFTEWITAISEQDTSLNEIPVYIIAHQGGGIRGMSWSARVLQQLDQNIPGFYEHIYAMTGASGGCNGMICYNTLKHYYPDVDPTKLDTILDTILNYDYLTPTLATYIFSESVQFLSPLPIKRFDRGKSHANSFEKGFCQESTRTMGIPTLSMYESNNNMENRIPHMLVNGTIAEKGQKVIYSTLQLSDEFKSDIDLVKYLNADAGYPTQDLMVKDAMLVCCRFPYILPGGTIPVPVDSKKSIGNIVDGGYLENTGVITALNLAIEIDSTYQKYRKKIESECDCQSATVKPKDNCTPSREELVCKHKKVKPIKINIIYVSNGNYQLDESTAVGFAHETALPIIGINSSREIAAEAANTETITTIIKRAGFEYGAFYLPRTTDEELALGWVMSDNGLAIIKNYATNLEHITIKNPNQYDNNIVEINTKTYGKIKDYLYNNSATGK
jgi:hypothetical protein